MIKKLVIVFRFIESTSIDGMHTHTHTHTHTHITQFVIVEFVIVFDSYARDTSLHVKREP